MVKALQLQIQPDDEFDEILILDYIKSGGFDLIIEVTSGDDSGRYVNFNCWTRDDLKAVWNHLRQLLEDKEIADRSIVTCTGEHGWDDFLLLHTFTDETIDVLE